MRRAPNCIGLRTEFGAIRCTTQGVKLRREAVGRKSSDRHENDVVSRETAEGNRLRSLQGCNSRNAITNRRRLSADPTASQQRFETGIRGKITRTSSPELLIISWVTDSRPVFPRLSGELGR